MYTDRKIKSGEWGLWQVHGAYIQGIGYYLSEEYQIDAANGKVCHTDPSIQIPIF
jgi:xanthine dehydrogenase molybdopterin-binding subunit B